MLKENHIIAKVSLDSIKHNCNIIRQLIPPGCRICAAAKCNAYGHGIEQVLPAFEQAGVQWLCVACLHEAVEIRKLGWKKPLLLLGSEFSLYDENQKQQWAQWIIENDLRITAMNSNDIEILRRAAIAASKQALIHVELDSGMRRMGLSEKELFSLISKFKTDMSVSIEGIYTHIATADETDKVYAYQQLNIFENFLQKLRSQNIYIPIIHAANAAAIIDIPQSHYDMVRPGISIYGCHSSPEMINKPDFKLAMQVVTYLTLIKTVPKGSFIGYGRTFKLIRDSIIGVVPIGYGDGYNRLLSNKGVMKIDNHFVPIIGRISMDQTILDLTDVAQHTALTNGKEVIVIDNDRSSPNNFEKIAVETNSLPNEIMTRLGHRVKRVAVASIY